MREFFGFGGYQRPAEGFLSWQHLLFVSILTVVMVVLAVCLGRKYKGRSESDKNRVLIWAAIIMDGIEIIKIVIQCFRAEDPMHWVYNLPLFLCSIQFITIPVAALSHGRLRQACLDFILMFGLLGALLGTYAAGNNYAAYPVLCLDNVVSGITHTTAGFACIFIGMTGLASMKKKNLSLSVAVLLAFCAVAYVVNVCVGGNYMFLMGGDGTPYDILYNLVNGHRVLYPILVVVLFLVYMVLFHLICALIRKRKKTDCPQSVQAA